MCAVPEFIDEARRGFARFTGPQRISAQSRRNVQVRLDCIFQCYGRR